MKKYFWQYAHKLIVLVFFMIVTNSFTAYATDLESYNADTPTDEFVTEGYGDGITTFTEQGESDVFSVYNYGDNQILPIRDDAKKRIEQYLKSKNENSLINEVENSGTFQDSNISFWELQSEMVVDSDAGTFSIYYPLLNTYVSSGGIERIGAPIGEQRLENGMYYQEFQNGMISTEQPKEIDTLVVRRNNSYYFKNSLSDGEADKVITYGKKTDSVYVGDWNGDGRDTLCVRRGNKYYFKNSLSDGEADSTISYGKDKDIVLVGDWDGDGKDTLCVRRGNIFYFKNTISGGEADISISYGKSGDMIFAGDWDGDGLDTLCVLRGNRFYVKNDISGGEADFNFTYGRIGDIILIGDWNGDGVDTLCVRRNQTYYFKNTITTGVADLVVNYGRAADQVYAGNWKSTEKAANLESSEVLFNNSHNLSVSRLTKAFAGNAVNSVSFRKNALTTYIDSQGNEIQYAAYYDAYGYVVLAKRENQGNWYYQWTSYQGNITDAHNSISIAVDGNGYLHAAWSQHAGNLVYLKAEQPGTLNLFEYSMIGEKENLVTYPEFYLQPDGNLVFLYRYGSSGNGNLVLNQYVTQSQEWIRVQDDLISGENNRSSYWQACIDYEGKLHISWVWRETDDVMTNYNMSYVVSSDSTMQTFRKSTGEEQQIPITESTCETIQKIGKGQSLINQTSMAVDENNNPYIISYWRNDKVVQYNILRFTGDKWIVYDTGIRNTDFTLSGIGTRPLPCARPQIVVQGKDEKSILYVLFRDEEHQSKASMAKFTLNENEIITEKMIDITNSSVGEWEPTYDINLWRYKKKLQLFMQIENYAVDGTQQQYKTEDVYVIDISSLL